METRTDHGPWTPLPQDHPHLIIVAGAPIPVRTLQQEAQTYTRLGRTERADELRALIEKQEKEQP